MTEQKMYRGIRKDNGKPVVGWLLRTVEGDRIIEANMSDEDIYCGFAWEDVSVPDDNSGCHAVHESSVAQSTGREDKNGDEIFGGMRVRRWDCPDYSQAYQVFVIEWYDEKACWGLRNGFGLAPGIPPCEVVEILPDKEAQEIDKEKQK